MKIGIFCPKCDKHIIVDPSAVGLEVPCPTCSALFTIKPAQPTAETTPDAASFNKELLEAIKCGLPTSITIFFPYAANRFRNQIAFYEAWNAAKTFPALNCLALTERSKSNQDQRCLILLAGDSSAQEERRRRVNGTEGDELLKKALPGKSWKDFIAPSSAENYSLPGSSLTTLDPFRRLLVEIEEGRFEVVKIIAVAGTVPHTTSKAQPTSPTDSSQQNRKVHDTSIHVDTIASLIGKKIDSVSVQILPAPLGPLTPVSDAGQRFILAPAQGLQIELVENGAIGEIILMGEGRQGFSPFRGNLACQDVIGKLWIDAQPSEVRRILFRPNNEIKFWDSNGIDCLQLEYFFNGYDACFLFAINSSRNCEAIRYVMLRPTINCDICHAVIHGNLGKKVSDADMLAADMRGCTHKRSLREMRVTRQNPSHWSLCFDCGFKIEQYLRI